MRNEPTEHSFRRGRRRQSPRQNGPEAFAGGDRRAKSGSCSPTRNKKRSSTQVKFRHQIAGRCPTRTKRGRHLRLFI